MQVKDLKGAGPKTTGLLKKLKIETTEDLLEHYPVRYTQYPAPIPICELTKGRHAIRVMVRNYVKDGANGSKSLTVSDSTGRIVIRWFHNPYVARMLQIGREYVFLGNADIYQGRLYLSQPSYYPAEEYLPMQGSLQPTYRLTGGLKNETLFKLVLEALRTMPEPEETLPEEVLYRYQLISRGDALRCIHYPASWEYLEMARRRIIFEEFYQLLYSLKGRFVSRGFNCFRIHESTSVQKIVDSLPFHLTASQERTVKEIREDFEKDLIASRLIQGDVGSGKTIVALLAMAIMADNGFQSALMAPTEVLAEQHYREAVSRFSAAGVLDKFSPVLLTGSMKAKEKDAARKRIADGTAKIIIGTHALIQEAVEYRDLALVIIDEQHRFGVEQRQSLSQKGNRPVHTIIMTATPIPRTTAGILFGGMDISVMADRPAGRPAIKNCVVDKDHAAAAYAFVKSEIEKGHQAYIICPLVDDTEDEKKSVEGYQKQIERYFPDIPTALLYGRMDPAKKRRSMERFVRSEAKILVSTTVVEVGVNVPNATVMLVENANMFGLLQLHQLRGRVGRGQDQSYCLLMNSLDTPCERLNILAGTDDGFAIAEADYRLRRGGNLLGTTQSGDMGFRLGDVIRDEAILVQAREAVEGQFASVSTSNI